MISCIMECYCIYLHCNSTNVLLKELEFTFDSLVRAILYHLCCTFTKLNVKILNMSQLRHIKGFCKGELGLQ